MSVLAAFAHSAIRNGVRLPRPHLLERWREKEHLIDLIRRLRVDCVLDVGANKGQFARTLRNTGYDGAIYSFEPIEEDFRTIIGDETWKTFNIAVGAADTQAQFNVVRNGDCTVLSSLHTPIYFHGEARTVPVRRLDSVLSLPDDTKIFLKTDTQGHDLDVIRGAEGLMSRIVGIQCEISVTPVYKDAPHYTEVLSGLEALGFSLLDLQTVARANDGTVIEYDCFMVRPQAL
jgi:FkbM family methyltransferase